MIDIMMIHKVSKILFNVLPDGNKLIEEWSI